MPARGCRSAHGARIAVRMSDDGDQVVQTRVVGPVIKTMSSYMHIQSGLQGAAGVEV